jgi:LysM repeat protein
MRCTQIVQVISVILLLSISGLTFAQQYPGAAFFSYQCGSSGIDFLLQGLPALQASYSEIVGPLKVAVSIGQNQPIKIGTEVGLWALQSDELQVHLNKDPDATKLVISSAVCGRIVVAGSSGISSSQALAYVQVDGPGSGLAYAQVTLSGDVTAYAQLTGSGQAFAVAQTSNATNGSLGNSGRYHVVQAGENLFRIALRYGTTVGILASINNIPNPKLIYVGQKIYLP